MIGYCYVPEKTGYAAMSPDEQFALGLVMGATISNDGLGDFLERFGLDRRRRRRNAERRESRRDSTLNATSPEVGTEPTDAK